MVAAGEGATNTNGNNGGFIGGRLGWAGGPVNVAGAYGTTRIPGNDDFKVWNVGASYSLPVVKLSVLYHHAEFNPTAIAGAGAGTRTRTQKVWALGANVPLGQGEIRATYQRSDMGGGGPTFIGLRNEDDTRQYVIGYIYNLSKRTAVYADGGRLQNRGGSLLSIPGGASAGFLGGQTSTAYGLGVRHSF